MEYFHFCATDGVSLMVHAVRYFDVPPMTTRDNLNLFFRLFILVGDAMENSGYNKESCAIMLVSYSPKH